MLWNEFVEGTKCKDTEYNYSVYKNLEELYMNNDKLTKEDIYKVGKQLVDNSPTEKEIEFKNHILNEIAIMESDIVIYERDIDRYEWYIHGVETNDVYTAENKKFWIKDYKYQIKWRKEEIKKMKQKIKIYKYWFLTK